MNTVTLNSGATMPKIGLGTWKSEPGKVAHAIREAIDAGYRHIDCAPVYENEAEVGAALFEATSGDRINREDLWVTSKLWNDSHAPEDVRPALEKTLSDLKLDYLDLYLIHWPVVQRKGVYLPEKGSDLLPLAQVPLHETWGAMEDLVEAGLCRSIGVSNFSAKKVESLIAKGKTAPAVCQVELHPYLAQNSLLEFCKANSVHVTAYSPLGSRDRPDGLKADNEPILLEDEMIERIAEKRGASAAQVLLAWALARGTSVIPKSVHAERIRQNLAAGAVVLTPEDISAIDALDRNRRYVSGDFWALEGSPYSLESLWDE